jgi:hypothetical protein
MKEEDLEELRENAAEAIDPKGMIQDEVPYLILAVLADIAITLRRWRSDG